MTHPAQDALASLDEYLTRRADAEYPTNGIINPNEEMILLSLLRGKIAPALQSASREWMPIDNDAMDGNPILAYFEHTMPHMRVQVVRYVGTVWFDNDGNPWTAPTSWQRITPPKQEN